MGTLIVIPPSMIMDKLFRLSRTRPSRVEEKVLDLKEKMKKANEKKGIIQKKKKMLPWWCSIIAWILCLISIGLSIFLIFSYSLQFGKEKSISWLGSIMMSITQSVLIFQPLKVKLYHSSSCQNSFTFKVFLVSALLTMVCRKVDTDDIDDEDKVQNSVPADDEELISGRPKSGKREKIEMKEIDPEKLEILKMRKQKEREMTVLLKDLMIYSIFLFFLMSLAGNNRNISAFHLNEQVKNLFEKDGNLEKVIHIILG